ncbi:hypothetical protein [Sphingobacterium siyangense]|nr:hypothetical protein [Sphingobacterium siyangense]
MEEKPKPIGIVSEKFQKLVKDKIKGINDKESYEVLLFLKRLARIVVNKYLEK